MKINKFSKKPENIESRTGSKPIVCYPNDTLENDNLNISIELITGISLGVFFGLIIDNYLQTKPLMLIIFFIIGTLVGFYNMYKTLKKYKFKKGIKMAAKKANKSKVLETVKQDINKEYGEGSIMSLGGTDTLDVEAISTGCLSLDMALGVGGVPKGRIIEVFGPESSGKTTLALHIVAECQKNGGSAAFIDAENALDPVYAENLGCKPDDLLVSQPDSGEQALDILQKLLETAALDVIVIDSVAALVPRKELEGQIGDVTVGLQARLMSQALRKLSGPINKSRTCVVFINQIREKIGVMFGSPETTPGGRALKFYSSVRLDIRRIAAIKEGTDMTGNRTRVKVVKNKVAPPFKMTEFDIMYGKGISYAGDLLDLALQGGVVEKMGSWFSYKGEKIAQGREKVKMLLESDDKLLKSVLSDVKAYLELA